MTENAITLDNLDSLDKKLIYELNWNARLSHAVLAKKFRTSKQVIGYRIKKLEDAGILKSYHAVIDWRKLGYNAIRVYMKWENITLEKEKEVYELIKKDPLFMWAIRFEGDIDIAFYVWVKDMTEFSRKWFYFISKYKKYILRYEIYESVEMIHYPMKFLKENYETPELVIGRESKAEYDETDYEILKILTENAQTTLVDIATHLKMSAPSVLYRIKELEKKRIILGYYALIDTDKLALEFYKVDFYVNDMSKLDMMNSFAKEHPQIVYRMRTIGGPDFEIEAIVKDAIELKALINEIRIKFGDSIKFNRFHRFEYSIKQIYLPGGKVFN
ncbi:MAG: Lrp/AsnC family transcriptional regulator [Nanoarchaeota archaeon]